MTRAAVLGGHIAETAVAAACGYECVAITSRGRIPTLSELQRRYDVLAWLLVGFLSYHLVHYGEQDVEQAAEEAAERAVAKVRWLLPVRWPVGR